MRAAALAVILVEAAHDVDRDRQLVGEQPRIDVADADRVRREHGVIEPHAVEVLHHLEARLPRLVGRGELGVAREDLVGARVQREVDGRHVELGEHACVGLALLPARGHHGHRAADAEVAQHAGHRGLRVLRAEERDRRGVGLGRWLGRRLGHRSGHRARTFTVCPTTSSMRRSSS
jgi:hypothetical protein